MTERTKARIQAIQENQEARNKYRDAIIALRELRIFDVLRERELNECSPFNMDSYHDSIQFHKLMGYIKCIEDIQSLIDTPEAPTKWVIDFGARESLKEQGYTDAEIVKMLGEE